MTGMPRRLGRGLQAGSLFILALTGARGAAADEARDCGTASVTPAAAFTIPKTAHDATPQIEALRSGGRIDPQTDSAILPHGDFVVLVPIDHTGSVADGAAALSSEERGRLTQALVALALQGWGTADDR